MAATRRAGLDQDDRRSCCAPRTDGDASHKPQTPVESMGVVYLDLMGHRTADPLGHGHLGSSAHLDEAERRPEIGTETKSRMGRGEEAAAEAMDF